MKNIKVCFVLTTRGNYAKLKNVIAFAKSDDVIDVQVVAGGMVALEKYGRIFEDLEENAISPDEIVSFVVEGETPLTMAKSTGLAMYDFAHVFSRLEPDLVVVVGDRFETLAIALAAHLQNIRVAHLEGGEVTGSVDESLRHAITKLSHLHFVASEEAANRVINMGEAVDSVFTVGSTSIDALASADLEVLDKVSRYQESFGQGPILTLEKKKYLVLIQHPVTTEYQDTFSHIEETITAIQTLAMPTVWIWPNMDAGSDGVNRGIRFFKEKVQPDYIHFFKSLKIEYFGPLLKNAACIVGNSSSGIRESAFLGTPAVNIGTRQDGRERGPNVIDVPYDAEKIVEGVRTQLEKREYCSNPVYGDGFASQKIVGEIKRDLGRPVQKRITY